jgi:hypothetical protein
MRWLWSHLRLGSWSALLTLTIQFALSFGPLHFDRIDPRSDLVSLALRSEIQAPLAALPAAPEPTQRKPVGLAGDFCAVCSAIQLVGSIVPSAAPTLPLPAIFGRISPDATGEIMLATLPHLSFQPRAPPQV